MNTEPSKLRQKNPVLLSETDRRYAGKRTSRKHIDKDSEGKDNQIN